MGYVDNAEFSCTADMLDTINSMVDHQVRTMRQVTAEQLGLDPRCGSAWVDKDYIVCYLRNSFDYYGGFEYVDKGCISVLGEYKFYSREDDRVNDCLECLMEEDGLCESEE
jgi:hypothetical protein